MPNGAERELIRILELRLSKKIDSRKNRKIPYRIAKSDFQGGSIWEDLTYEGKKKKQKKKQGHKEELRT